MAIATKLSDSEVRTIANAVLGPAMCDLAFAGVDVTSGETFEGEPSLSVSAKVGAEVAAPFDPKRFSRLHGILHDALLARGEERFPYFNLHRAGDEPLVEDDMMIGEP